MLYDLSAVGKNNLFLPVTCFSHVFLGELSGIFYVKYLEQCLAHVSAQ